MTTALNLKIANQFFACHCDYAHVCYSLDAKGSKVNFFYCFQKLSVGPWQSPDTGIPIIPPWFHYSLQGGIMKCTTSASNDEYYKRHCVKGAIIT